MPSSLFVAVCTYNRPALLRRCLRSVLAQLPAGGAAVRLAVVDNDPARSAAPVVEKESASSGHTILYAAEPSIGIPHARNHAVRLCLEAGSDWLVFIDDDTLAAPGWLQALQSAAAQCSADAIAGPVEKPLPEAASFWALPRRPDVHPEGAAVSVARTNNVAIRADVFRRQPSLRFDTAMCFTGGEDTDFFRRLVAGGGTIRWSNRPRIIEPVPPERLTFRWQMARKFRTACNDIYIYRKLRPVLPLYARRGARAVWFLTTGAALFTTAMILLPLWPGRLKKVVLKGALQIGWALGTLSGIVGHYAQPYHPDRIGPQNSQTKP